MHISITDIDPTDPADLDDVEALLDFFRGRINPPDPDDIVGIVRALMKNYGKGRTDYIRLVAGDKEGASKASVAELFKGDGRAIGGTHSSIERAWRSLGGERFAAEFIETTPDGTHKMNSVFRAAVEQVVRELGLDDPPAAD